MTEQEQLEALCRKMGASPQQAEVMARQLVKRADQLVLQGRGTRVEVMAQLLEILVRGRSGEGPPPDSGERGPR